VPPVLTNPAAPLDSMVNHSWLSADQKAAFGSAPFTTSALSVSDYLSPWLSSNGFTSQGIRKNDAIVQDGQITTCLMNQAMDFLHRAICNAAAHHVLARKGFETWSRVTNYYASYFSVHSLLCLQGRTITKLQLDNPLTVHIVPIEIRNHVFGVTSRHIGRNPNHQAPWERFYGIYDRYAVSHQAYEIVSRRAYITDPTDEPDERNTLNYTPFRGFAEIRDLARCQIFVHSFSGYAATLDARTTLPEFLEDLKAYATDPEYKYFARTLIKLALAGEIIRSIRPENLSIDAEWSAMLERWQDFLAAIFPDSRDCYLLKFVPLIGSPPN
jgi:hypothetical protein